MVILRQSTEIKVRIGPFVDATDGVTPEGSVALGTADQAEALKADGAATASLSAATWTAVTGADGWYDLTLTTSHTDTVGELIIVVQDSSLCLPVFQRFQVIEEAVYDALYAASAPGYLQPTTAGRTLDIQATGEADVNVTLVGGASTNVSALATNVDAIKTKTDFLPSATAGAAGGVFIAGTNAATTITSSSGSALTLSSTGGNGHGLAASGNGTGYGVSATGGVSGGHGIYAIGSTTGSGIYSIGGSLSAGIYGQGGANGAGIQARGGSTSGAGFYAVGQTNSPGINASGQGSGNGFSIIAGATGIGLSVTGGSTSGDGFYVSATSGDGIDAVSAGGGVDIRGDITGNVTGNVSGSVASVTGGINTGAGTITTLDALDTAQDSQHTTTQDYLTNNLGANGAAATEAGGTGDQLSAIPWNASWDAEVQSEVDDALDTAISELTVAAPTATPTLRTGLMLLYMMARNKLVVQTSGTDAIEVYNDAGTKICSKLITDDGSDYTEAEMT